MDDALLVRGGEAGAELAGDFEGLVVGEATDAAEEGAEVFAVDELHREEDGGGDGAVGRAGDGVDVVDAADVGVADLACDADFVEEFLDALLIRGERGGEELQGDDLAEGEVVGAVDLTHAAFAEEAGDAVALGDELARGEAGVRCAGAP